MAKPRPVVSPGVREELIEAERRLLDLAERIGAERSAEKMRRRIDDLEAHRPIHRLHGWQVGMPPNSGPWTLTADDQLLTGEDARAGR